MSRIGKMPIALPAGVEVKFVDGVVTVKGAKGTLSREVVGNIGIEVEGVADFDSVFHQIRADGFGVAAADAHEDNADVKQCRNNLNFFHKPDFVAVFRGGIGVQP